MERPLQVVHMRGGTSPNVPFAISAKRRSTGFSQLALVAE